MGQRVLVLSFLSYGKPRRFNSVLSYYFQTMKKKPSEVKHEIIKIWYENLCEDPVDGTTTDCKFMDKIDEAIALYEENLV